MHKKIINEHSKKLLICLIVVLSLLGYFLYHSIQVKSLTKLGYSDQDASGMVKVTTIYNIVSDHRDMLHDNIDNHSNELDKLGVPKTKVDSILDQETKLVSKEKALSEFMTSQKTSLETKLTTLKKQADALKIDYSLKDKKINEQVDYLDKLVTTKVNKDTKKYETFLLDNGYTSSQIDKLTNKSNYQNMLNLKKSYRSELKKQEANQGFQTQELKNEAMRMFRLTNEYRRSLGLKPYEYNYAKQSCVFKEAKAYANNKNPHNWLCPCANENASLANINSDYVGIAMHFFKNDPPHEAVLSGNYNSVAIAFVEKDGMVYMIMDVF